MHAAIYEQAALAVMCSQMNAIPLTERLSSGGHLAKDAGSGLGLAAGAYAASFRSDGI